MFSPCMDISSMGMPASSHSSKTCMLGKLMFLKFLGVNVGEWWLCVSLC